MQVHHHVTTATFNNFRKIMPDGKMIQLATIVGGDMKDAGLEFLSRKIEESRL
jgi:hypothetical protein